MSGGGGMPGMGAGFGSMAGFEDPEMAKLSQRDAELDQKAHRIADELRRNRDGEKRETLLKDLKSIVGEQFEARQARRKLELKRLEDQVARLRKQMDKREDSKSQIVGRRVAELSGDDDLGFE